MEFIYNPKNRTIREAKDNSKEFHLTNIECRFIESLSNGRVNTYEDIAKYIHDHTKYKNEYFTLIVLKGRLLKKMKMNIKVIRKIGLRLEDEIYVE